MELIRGLHNMRARHHGSVVTFGAFDGLHRGHQAVLADLRARAAQLGVPSTVILFEPLPREFFAPVASPARLMSFREKVPVLAGLGIDRVLLIRFDRAFSSTRAPEFVRNVFVEGLGARHVVIGDDLHFGRDREGNIHTLRAAGAEFGFSVSPMTTVELDGERVSSTRVRNLLASGDFAGAERLLGRPYFMTGKVIYGRQLGATIGIPTANLQLHRFRSPLAGVFAVEVRGIGERLLHGVANVGTRPTVNDGIKANLEVHVLDFDGNIYGRTIDVVFRHRIREERKFGSLDELRARIGIDIDIARDHFSRRAT